MTSPYEPTIPPSSIAPPTPRRGVGGVALVAAIFAVAFALRAPLTEVPPLVSEIEVDLGLSGLAVGLLTALPVLCMGLFAPLAQRLAHVVGREGAVALALAVLLLGSLLRLAGGHLTALYGGTVLVGVGLAIAGTVLPGIVKEFFPGRAGLVTGIYMFAMMLGAAMASALAVPLTAALGSWQRALGSSAVLVVVAILAWLPVVRRVNDHTDPITDPSPTGGLPWRSRTAWVVAIYLTASALAFYSQVAWIPPYYVASGSSPEEAGLLLAGFSLAQLVAGIGGPALADHVRDRRVLLYLFVGMSVVGMIGMTWAGSATPWLWVLVLGFGMGGGFSLGLVFLVAYAATPATSARLTAMAFLVSYGLAALGPSVFGALRDATGGFTTAWSAVLVCVLVQFVVAQRMRPGRVAGWTAVGG